MPHWMASLIGANSVFAAKLSHREQKKSNDEIIRFIVGSVSDAN
jgi:hypothetical protein